MKKYKLIKWYPSLPKDVEVGTEVTYYPSTEEYSDYDSIYDSTIDLNPEEVEGNPDFWEEVTVKFEILSFYTESAGSVIRKKDNGLFSYGKYPGAYTLEDMLSGDKSKLDLNESEVFDYVIHSVKRLSDNKIFTVGDTVVYLADTPNLNFKDDINRFELKDNELSVYNSGCLVSSIKGLQELPQVLFKTEKDEDIYKGDKFYYLNTDTFKILTTVAEESFRPHICFLTEEDAKEYVLLNNPCLSVNDIFKDEVVYRGISKDTVIDMVKEKLGYEV